MRKLFTLLCIATTVVFTSCQKSKTEVGPQGPEGPAGMAHQGFIKGTLNGNMRNGDTIKRSFSYEYYNSLEDSRYDSYRDGDTYYSFEFSRKSATESNSNVYFNFQDVDSNATTIDPANNYSRFDFTLLSDLGNGTYLYFTTQNAALKVSKATDIIYIDNQNSKMTISNYKFNAATGQLKFDYVIDLEAYDNSTYNNATLKGSVDVIVRKEAGTYSAPL